METNRHLLLCRCKTVITYIRKASAVSLLQIACPEVYIRVHFWTRVLAEQKRRRWMKPRTSLSVLKLQGASKNKAETRHRMYVLYILWLRLNSLLIYSPAIRGGSATLGIYFSSNVLPLAKLASLSGNTA